MSTLDEAYVESQTLTHLKIETAVEDNEAVVDADEVDSILAGGFMPCPRGWELRSLAQAP